MPSLVGLGFRPPARRPKTLSFFTGSRCLSYSEADLEVFRPAGATRCTDGVKFGMEEGTEDPLLHAEFHPIGATIRA